MIRKLDPKTAAFFEERSAAWQVVSAGTRTQIRLPEGGPFSDNAVVVVFERPVPSIVVVPAGDELVCRAGAMPIGPEAGARLDELAKLRVRTPFGLRKTAFERGPVAAMKDASKTVENHVRVEFFNGKKSDPIRLFSPRAAVLRHIDSLLEHCGVRVASWDDEAVVVKDLGSALGVVPGAIAAIHRGGSDPESTYRIAKVDNGWRVPISIFEAGLLARVGRAFRAGIDVLHARYDSNRDLEKPFRANPRRPTELASVTKLPRCVVEWFLEIPERGLKIEHRKLFAGFANETNRASEVYEIAKKARPDLIPQLREAEGWKTIRRTCGDILMNPSKYATLGLVCNCGASQKRKSSESEELESAPKRASTGGDVFSPDSPLSSGGEDEAHFF